MVDFRVRRIPLTQGCEALIDEADYESEHVVEFGNGITWRGRIGERPWCASVKKHTTYAKATIIGSLELRLHRVVMDAKLGELIDHIDGNGLNNRRDNLRLATNQGNSANSKRQIGSASRFKGRRLRRRLRLRRRPTHGG